MARPGRPKAVRPLEADAEADPKSAMVDLAASARSFRARRRSRFREALAHERSLRAGQPAVSGRVICSRTPCRFVRARARERRRSPIGRREIRDATIADRRGPRRRPSTLQSVAPSRTT
jgi:hypothetical protein